MLYFHFEHAQVPKTMTQNQTKATICSALGDLANSRPIKSTAFYELPPLLSYYKVPSVLVCPIFSHQPELCIHATPHPSQIYPEITYREVSIVPIALSQCPSGKISVKLTAGQHLEYLAEPCSTPHTSVLFTASQWPLAADFIAERWAMLRG